VRALPLLVVLRALHDPLMLMRTGPTIASLTVDPDDPDMYEIVHKASYMSCTQRPRSFKARFIRLRDGVTTEVFAKYGTRVSSHWRARSIEGGKSSQVEVENSIKVNVFLAFKPSLNEHQCLFFLAPYISSRILAARVEALVRIAAALEDEPDYLPAKRRFW